MKRIKRTPAQAMSIPNSPFADFHMELRGYDIVVKKTGRKCLKWEIWHAYKDRPVELRRIQLMTHPDFKYVPNDNLKFKTK